MKDDHEHVKAMSWLVDDATRMAFDDSSFDQVVDKSLIDCMCYCKEPEWEGCVGRYITECYRVLKPGGVALFATDRTQSLPPCFY